MSALKPVNLLLVGRTGNGKSSTGNSILGRTEFKASMNSEPFTKEHIKPAETTHGHLRITVVDGPGIGDASLSDPGEVQTTITLTEHALGFCPPGFHAVLVILKYGERFTKQEKDAVYMVKAILGSQVLARHGIIVMTRGDNFEIDEEENGVTFVKWCRQQTADVAELFQECGQRMVLFNNRTKDKIKLDEQRECLLGQVAKCQSDPYRLQDYHDAKRDRLRLGVSSNFSIIEEKNKKFLNEINAALSRLDISGKPDDAKNKLTSLELELDKYRKELDRQTQGTDVGKPLYAELDVVGMAITTKRNLAKSYLKLEQVDKHGATKHGLSASKQPPEKEKYDTRRRGDTNQDTRRNGHNNQDTGGYGDSNQDTRRNDDSNQDTRRYHDSNQDTRRYHDSNQNTRKYDDSNQNKRRYDDSKQGTSTHSHNNEDSRRYSRLADQTPKEAWTATSEHRALPFHPYKRDSTNTDHPSSGHNQKQQTEQKNRNGKGGSKKDKVSFFSCIGKKPKKSG